MITLVLPTRNRSGLLDCAIASVFKQKLTRANFEIVLLDNGSIDDTHEIALKWIEQLGNLSYFYVPEPGLHVGRHRGMLEAKGDVLVFADDDIEATPCWLGAIHEAFQDPDLAMMGGNDLPMFMGAPPDWLYELWSYEKPDKSHSIPLLSIQQNPPGKRKFSPYWVWGCNFAIRKEVLLAAGGFHPDGMPQDLIRFRGDGETHVSKYVADNNLKCIFDSRATVYHKVTPERMTFEYFRNRGFNQGISDSYTQLRAGISEVKSHHSIQTRFARWSLRKLRRMKSFLCGEKKISPAIEEYQAGFQAGFAFHQDAYRDDPEVRAWVHKKYYF